jgi:hypothetical protein
MKRIFINTFVALFLIAALSSCSIKTGLVVTNSHYVYPNSNVTPLGTTSAEVKKFSVVIPPGFKARDVDNLYNQALSKHSGSDLIIDYSVDTKVTTFFIFHFLKTSLVGTAAKMEVGKQDIGMKTN